MQTEKTLLLAMIALLSLVSFLMLEPFLSYILAALILAFVMHPVQERLAPRVGERVSAFSLVILAIVVSIVPLVLAGTAILQDAGGISEAISGMEFIDVSEAEQVVERYTGQEVDLEQSINDALNQFANIAFGGLSQFVNILTRLTIGLGLMLFLLYYFIKDGSELSQRSKDLIPLSEDVKDNLYRQTNRTTWAVIKGHVLVALAQGLIAGLGLFIVGIPNVAFWTFIMIILAFVPVVGTVPVWGPASIYLILTDSTLAGLFLLVYGATVVGLTDNILRPLVVDREAELHPTVILAGVIGGVYVFGAPGLFIGPIIFGVFKSVLIVFRDNYT